MTRQEWLLEVLNAADGGYLTPVQLQKILYILGRKFPDQAGPEYYHFIHYNYGPFSKQIYHDLESPKLGRFVKELSRPGQQWSEYAITREGTLHIQDKNVPARIRKYVRQLVNWARSLSFDQLVKAVYKAYPETRENSIFQDQS